MRWQNYVKTPDGNQTVDSFKVAKWIRPWMWALTHAFRPAAETADTGRVWIDDFDVVTCRPQDTQELACGQARTFRE